MFNLNSELETNLNQLKALFQKDDIVKFRTFNSKDSKIRCGIVFIDGLTDKTIINENVIKPIVNSKNHNSLKSCELCSYIEESVVLCDEVEKTKDVNVIITSIMYGKTALFIDGVFGALILNTKGAPTRAISTPPSENVVRGSREGFTESILVNINLIRKRIQDPNLKIEFNEIGRRTKTKICIVYIKDIAQDEIVNEVKKRLDNIDIDGILESGYIEEFIKDEPLSPFKTIANTERPDVAAGKLLEGRVVIICDGTPFVLSLPCLFIELFQASEDYYNNYLFSSFNRLLRIICFFLTTSTPAIYVSVVAYHQEMIPTSLFMSIASSREGLPFPTIVEAIFMLLTFEILREAGVRLPQQIGQAISIVGALVLGEAAVSAKFISAPMVIVVALTGVSGFAVPSMLESVIVLRLLFLIASFILGLYGYIFAIIGLFTYLMSMKSFGVNYMEYTDIISKENIRDTAIRVPHWLMKYRPKFIVKNRIRMHQKRRDLQ
ncbi:spore germination protein [Clostridium sp. MSJ-4]|uniref:Spore germination protein n=1 Tax=Clostridium simiarum TaxID=2841506 RepID=A0ABS6F3B7_9CLOT|nr:spore germination protein [Clostridium simiarum]MBU5593011.1 spore germination protein [Clostridium simiarum]